MRLRLAFASLALLSATPALAALKAGDAAPAFKADGAMAGKPIHVNLKAQLRKGPVVLYFFPAAFTGGCNAEAHAFAEQIADFHKAGATVIGMSADDVPTLVRFSSEKCAGQFAVASASPALAKSYDVATDRIYAGNGTAHAITNRTSYVIAPDGKVLLAHSDPSPLEHIELSLKAVRDYRAAHLGH
jgi:thioredoxin-dependent peroxiredoxin